MLIILQLIVSIFSIMKRGQSERHLVFQKPLLEGRQQLLPQVKILVDSDTDLSVLGLKQSPVRERDEHSNNSEKSPSKNKLLHTKKVQRQRSQDLQFSHERRLRRSSSYDTSMEQYERDSLPPARELENVWDLFIDENKKQVSLKSRICSTIKEIHRYPSFHCITVLSLERLGLKRVFEYLQPCHSLIALYLKHNKIITRDLINMKHLGSPLRVLDLSSNGVHFLPDEEYFAELSNLSYLMLHKNEIVGSKQLKNLMCLKQLRHLTLQGNPCTKVKGYRQRMVEEMLQLRSLDSFIILDFERKEMAKMFPPEAIQAQKLHQLKRFRPFNKEYQYWRVAKFAFEVPSFIQPQQVKKKAGKLLDKNVTPNHTLLRHDFQLTTESASINKHLRTQLNELGRKFEYCSPIMTIQRNWRRFAQRKAYRYKQKMTAILNWALNRWYKRLWFERLLSATNLNRDHLFRLGRIRFIQKWLSKMRQERSAAWIITKRAQSILRMQLVQDRSFSIAFGLTNKTNWQISTQNRLLFRKTQLNLLEHIGLKEIVSRAQCSHHFSLRSGVEVDTIQFRRSLIMNMVVSSYRHARVLRSLDLFFKIIQLAKVKNSQIAPATVTQRDERPPQIQEKHKDMKPTNDEEKILYEVAFEEDSDMANTIQKIATYNRWHEPVIQVFYEPFLRRLKAALHIQHWFKDNMWRKRRMPIFTERENGNMVLSWSLLERAVTRDNTPQVHYVLLQRIVKRIQRVWRRRCMLIRISTLSKIATYVAAIDSKEIYLEQTMYKNLTKIHQKAIGAPWYKASLQELKLTQKQSSSSTRTPPANQTGAFFDRKFRFEVSAVGKIKDEAYQVHLTNLARESITSNSKTEGKKVGRYVHQNLPQWFLKKAGTIIIPKMHRHKNRKSCNNILSLIHSTSFARSNETATRVLYLHEVEGALVQDSIRDIKLVKVTLSTVQEARNRAIVLALITADVRHSSDKFVRFFTQSDFSDVKSHQTVDIIHESFRLHNLVDTDTQTKLASCALTLQQVHGGLIIKRDEPYRTLLRAKPRILKVQHERLIVLNGADPRQIEERVGTEQDAKMVMSGINQNKSNEEGIQASQSFKINLSKKVSLIRGKTDSGIAATTIIEDNEEISMKKRQKELQSHSDLAKIKLKAKETKDKKDKVTALKRKLTHIKKRMGDKKEQQVCDSAPVLIPDETIEQSQKVPNLMEDVAEASIPTKPSVEHTDEKKDEKDAAPINENIDQQLNHLFEEYVEQQRFYRQTTAAQMKLEGPAPAVSSISSGLATAQDAELASVEENLNSEMLGPPTTQVLIATKLRDAPNLSKTNSDLWKDDAKKNSCIDSKSVQRSKTLLSQSAKVPKELKLSTEPSLQQSELELKDFISKLHQRRKDRLITKEQKAKMQKTKVKLAKAMTMKETKHSAKSATKVQRQASLHEINTMQPQLSQRSLFASVASETHRVFPIANKRHSMKDASSMIDREADIQSLNLDLKVYKNVAKNNILLQNKKPKQMMLAHLPIKPNRIDVTLPSVAKVFPISDRRFSLKDSSSLIDRDRNVQNLKFHVKAMKKLKEFEPPIVELSLEEDDVCIPWTPAQPGTAKFQSNQTSSKKLAPVSNRSLNKSQRSSLIESPDQVKINPMKNFRTPISEESKLGEKSGQNVQIQVKFKKRQTTSSRNHHISLQDQAKQRLTKQIIFSDMSRSHQSAKLLDYSAKTNAKQRLSLLTEKLQKNLSPDQEVSLPIKKSKVLEIIQQKQQEIKEFKLQGQAQPVIIPSKLKFLQKKRNFGSTPTIEAVMSTRIANQEIQKKPDIKQEKDEFMNVEVAQVVKQRSRKSKESDTRVLSKKLLCTIDRLVTMQQSSISASQERKTLLGESRMRTTALFTNVSANTRRSLFQSTVQLKRQTPL